MREIGADTAMNTAPAAGRSTSCDRRNTIRNINVIMPTISVSAMKSAADGRIASAKSKECAHRVAVAAKAVGHEVATAAKRSAAETRAAFHGDKPDTPAK